MKRAVFVTAIALAVAAAAGGVWLVARDGAPAEPVLTETAEQTLAAALASGDGVAAADWIRVGVISGAESGRYAHFRVLGADGREAWVYLVRLASGAWKIVSLTEGPPQCAAVERFGFPSAMISDCRVGEAQTVAEALASALAGEDVSGLRLVGTIELPPDPSCGCVLLTSGGASVRLNISASALAASGISVGDTVVISGGLGGDLSVDASSVIRATEDGTAAGAVEGGSPSTTGGDDDDDDPPPARPAKPATPAPEPSTTPPPTGGATGGGTVSVPGFPEWRPRLRYVTARYANPLDLDQSASDVPSLSGN